MTHPPEQPLVVETDPRSEDIRALINGLDGYGRERTGITDGKLIGLFLRAGDGAAVGGAFGWTWGGACYVRYLFVPADRRGRGEGTRLMREVERVARERGCGQIVLETHSFQAPEFYRKLGFAVTGRVDGYPRGHSYMTLVKRLDGEG